MKHWIVVFVIFVVVIFGFLLLSKAEYRHVCFDEDCFEVEVARTADEQSRGLMFREDLEGDKGMLFVYNEEGIYGFWMKNTLIPLDIIWIKDNKVVYIKENALPCNETCDSIVPDVESNYVLELNAGNVKELDIKVGDNVNLKRNLH